MISFEWDDKNATSNLNKHGVSFPEAQSVFYDDYAIQFFGDESSAEEERLLMRGRSNRGRILIVVHFERSKGEVIRFISARKATSTERVYYRGPKS